MSLATETDPVETLRLLLDDNTASGDWANAGVKPTHIEAFEASTFKTKSNRRAAEPAVYLWTPADASIEQFGAGYEEVNETHIVQAEVWDKESSTRAYHLVEDIRSICSQYATDNKSQTNWNRIVVVGGGDSRAESRAARRADHFVFTPQVECFAKRDA